MAQWLIWFSRFLVFVGVAAAFTFGGAQMGLLTGKRPTQLGLKNGQLHPVKPGSVNSVCSFSDADYSKIAPIAASKEPRAVFARLTDAIKDTSGATIIKQDGNYIYAEFQTPLLKFVDDAEFLLDEGNGVIHVRSASRLGKSDLGANRKRIERLREAVRTQLG
jgi:uncharacterized protein (DUF1499 family)